MLQSSKELPAPQSAHSATVPVQPSQEDLLEAYLATVRKHTMGVSEAEVQAILAEMQQHLLASAKAYEELGDAPDVALQNALASFGACQEIGKSLSTAYQTSGPARTVIPWATMRRAIRMFAVANLATMSVLLAITYVMFAGAFFRMDPLLPFLFFVVPLLVGWRIGASGKFPRAAFATFLALAFLVFVTSPLMLVMLYLPSSALPFSDLLVVLPMLFVAWLPVGCIAAGVAELRTKRNMRRLRLAR